jgi:hypothetical protein
MVAEHRIQLDRLALALLERETLSRSDIAELLADLQPVSDASRQVGVEIVRGDVVPAPPQLLPALRATPVASDEPGPSEP